MSIEQALRAQAALPTTFAKGQDLVMWGVISCEATRGAIGSSVTLDGQVEGSTGELYKTRVTLDVEQGDVIDYACTCPAAASYDGMCKHEVALALRYLGEGGAQHDPGTGTCPDEGPDAWAPSPWPAAPRRERARTAPSSARVTDLIAAMAARRMGEQEAARAERAVRGTRDAGEPVEVLCELTHTANATYLASSTYSLKLRVRRGRAKYVVRNVAELVKAWETGGFLSYGKSLEFAHVPRAFTPVSREVLAFVSRVARSQQALFASRWQYAGAGRGTDVRELPLAVRDVAELLDLLGGEPFAYALNAPASPAQPRELTVRDGDPSVPVRIEPSQRGGMDLTLPTGLDCLACAGRLYVFDATYAWRCSPEFSQVAGPVLSALMPVGGPLHIAEADLPEFCRGALPALRDACELSAPDELVAYVPPQPAFSFQVREDDGEVTCLATVAYGPGEPLSVYAPEGPGQPSRDIASECHAIDVVEEFFPVVGRAPELAEDAPHFDADDDELMYALLTDGLRELSGLGEVMLSERLRARSVRDSPQVSVTAAVHSGLLDLKVGASGLATSELAAYLASYKRRQKYVRLSNGDIMRLDEGARVLGELAAGLGVDAEALAQGALGLPAAKTLFVDELLRERSGVRLAGNADFRAIVRDFGTFANADIEAPASLAGVLRPYQLEGMRWLGTLERLGFGGILADDMGLGKTLQVIAHILARREAGDAGRTLVVCPASLVYNWTRELARFAPQLRAVAAVGTKPQRMAAIGSVAGGGAEAPDVLVTSYDLMRRDVKAYADVRFRRVVLDEAQYIKTPSTQVAKAAKCLQADVRFALTGTPVENRTLELWSIFDFLMPGLLGSREDFSKRYEGATENREAGAAARLRGMVGPFILRRLKADVLADLPEKSETVVYARMAGEQDKLYKAHQDRLALQVAHELPQELRRTKLQVLAQLTRLRQICCDPHLCFEDYAGESAKLETCLELVRSALDAGHKILLFSQFTSMLGIISKRLHAEGVRHLTLTGSTSKPERARLVDAFQAGEAPVFLISLKAGGVGLNLTAADVVIHYDPWWNTAAQDQATDRAHRLGQTRAVSVFKLICQDTIEERIAQMQESKRELAESVLGGEEVASASLTREDILALLDAREG